MKERKPIYRLKTTALISEAISGGGFDRTSYSRWQRTEYDYIRNCILGVPQKDPQLTKCGKVIHTMHNLCRVWERTKLAQISTHNRVDGPFRQVYVRTMATHNKNSDWVLIKAVKRRDTLKEELGEVESFIRTYKRISASNDEEGDAAVLPAVKNRSGIDASLFFQQRLEKPETEKIKSSPKRDVERVVLEVLEKQNQPTSSAVMLKLVTERGITIGGREPRWNLSAKMSRMEEVQSYEGFGWWFKDRGWTENKGPSE